MAKTQDTSVVLKGIKEISGSLTKIEGEKAYIKDAVAAIADASGLKKSQVSRLARVYHKQNFQEVVDEASEFQMLYQRVTKAQ